MKLSLVVLLIGVLVESQGNITINLELQNQNRTRFDIDCLSDTTTYSCSIESNTSSYTHLIWTVIVPGLMPLQITYDNISSLNTSTDLDTNIVTILTEIRAGYIASNLTLTVTNTTVNGIMIQCGIMGTNKTVVMSVNTSVPLPPTNFRTTTEYYELSDITVSFEWDPPFGSGSQVVVDSYLISITPTPVSHPNISRVVSSPWNVTLNYNTIYTATIRSENCFGQSSGVSVNNIMFVDCGFPPTPFNGYIGTFFSPRQGTRASVNYGCNIGFRPSLLIFSRCNRNAMWSPDPAFHICTRVEASVDLRFHMQLPVRRDITCPFDAVFYNCSVLTNSETPNLIWRYTISGQTPVDITYNSTSTINSVDVLGSFYNTSLLRFSSGFIYSIFVLEVVANISLSGVLECASENISNASEILQITTTAPPAPVSFNVTSEYRTLSNTTVTFQWDTAPPVVPAENYTISITPAPLSHPNISVVFGSPWNVTLNYEVQYNITITAQNCHGDSGPFSLPVTEFSLDCGPITPPINGVVHPYSNSSLGANATFQCNEDYIPSDIEITTCTLNGWYPLPEGLRCSNVDCGPPLPTPTNGNINYTSTIKGANATFQCEDGYYPDTPMIATCNSSGEWLPVPETFECVIINISDPRISLRYIGYAVFGLGLLIAFSIVLSIVIYFVAFKKNTKRKIKPSKNQNGEKTSDSSIRYIEVNPTFQNDARYNRSAQNQEVDNELENHETQVEDLGLEQRISHLMEDGTVQNSEVDDIMVQNHQEVKTGEGEVIQDQIENDPIQNKVARDLGNPEDNTVQNQENNNTEVQIQEMNPNQEVSLEGAVVQGNGPVDHQEVNPTDLPQVNDKVQEDIKDKDDNAKIISIYCDDDN